MRSDPGLSLFTIDNLVEFDVPSTLSTPSTLFTLSTLSIPSIPSTLPNFGLTLPSAC